MTSQEEYEAQMAAAKRWESRRGEIQVEMISVNDVLAGRLPDKAWGVHWADTNWTECRPHLADPSWAAGMSGRGSDAPVGVVLYGPLVCNACQGAELERGST